ncbi:MAG: dockerin type I domain-containing protein [Planctomycetota bacterium]|nr:dockerin type I domain-containing protein [Planctomycetota bacterium]
MRKRTTRSIPLCLLALITAVFFGQSAFGWQDEDGRVGLSHGRVDLSPGEDAENQDADGGAKLLQVGDRSAIHVNVSGLAPGATYDVVVSSGEESGSLGSITTRDGGVMPSRCYTGKLESPEEPEELPAEPEALPEEAAVDAGDGEAAGEDAAAVGGEADAMEEDGMDDAAEGDERERPERPDPRDRDNDRPDPRDRDNDRPDPRDRDDDRPDPRDRDDDRGHDWGNWGNDRDNDRGRSHGWNFWRPSRKASGSVTITLNRDYSEATYSIKVRRLRGEVSGVRIVLGDDTVIESEDLRGRFELAEGQVAAMAEGATVEIYTSDEDGSASLALSGGVSACFPFLDRMRERLAARRAGKGVLRFDTARDDVLPMGAESLGDLVGATMSVADADGAVMLAGEIGELSSARVRHPRHPGHNGRGNDRGDRDDGGADDADDAADNDDGDDVADNDAGGDDAAEGGDEAVAEEVADGVGAAFEELLELNAPELSFDVLEPHNARFLRGDSNDDGQVDVSDAVAVLGYLFQGGEAPYCADASDANDDGEINIGDPIVVLRSLFQGTARIMAPYPRAGYDRTPDELDCDVYEN